MYIFSTFTHFRSISTCIVSSRIVGASRIYMNWCRVDSNKRHAYRMETKYAKCKHSHVISINWKSGFENFFDFSERVVCMRSSHIFNSFRNFDFHLILMFFFFFRFILGYVDCRTFSRSSNSYIIQMRRKSALILRCNARKRICLDF